MLGEVGRGAGQGGVGRGVVRDGKEGGASEAGGVTVPWHEAWGEVRLRGGMPQPTESTPRCPESKPEPETRPTSIATSRLQVYVDTVGDADRHRDRLSRAFPGLDFTVCPKADSL